MTPDDPRHGTNAGYVAGCRDCCSEARYRYQKRAALRRGRGVSQYVPRAEVTLILDEWARYGVAPSAVAHAAGVAGTALTMTYPTLERSTLRATRAVTWNHLPDTAVVYADLTRRRIFSLGAAGHRVTSTCADNGMDINGAWRKSTRVRLGLARQIQSYYAAAPPWGTSKQAATRARQQGHLQPAEWDDPGTPAAPLGWDPILGAPIDYDPVVVDRILDGDMTLARTATKVERTHVVTKWRAIGRPLNELERLTGWEPRRYLTEVAS